MFTSVLKLISYLGFSVISRVEDFLSYWSTFTVSFFTKKCLYFVPSLIGPSTLPFKDTKIIKRKVQFCSRSHQKKVHFKREIKYEKKNRVMQKTQYFFSPEPDEKQNTKQQYTFVLENKIFYRKKKCTGKKH